jgi:hypothetical protein
MFVFNRDLFKNLTPFAKDEHQGTAGSFTILACIACVTLYIWAYIFPQALPYQISCSCPDNLLTSSALKRYRQHNENLYNNLKTMYTIVLVVYYVHEIFYKIAQHTLQGLCVSLVFCQVTTFLLLDFLEHVRSNCLDFVFVLS